MVSEISSNTSSLQILRASQAFRVAAQQNATKVNKSPEAQHSADPEALRPQTQNLNPIINQYKSYINDVKQFMSNKTDLSDEDIGYAIKYGKSILVDQRA